MTAPVVNRALPARPPEDKTTMWTGNGSAYLCYALLALVIVFFAAIRYRLREMPLERDEGEYAYAGQLLLQGVPPYQLAYNMKLPGTYGAYAVIMALFGQTVAGIHVGVLVVNAITTWLMFLLARKFFGLLPSVIASASYALLSTSPGVLGFEGHATHFVVLFALAGLVLLLNALEKAAPWSIFGAGCLLGLAFVMKQPGIFFPLFGAVYLLTQEWKRAGNWRNSLSRPAAYVVGTVVPFAITCVVLYRVGVFQKFWFWTFSYARRYTTSVDFSQGLEHLRMNAAGAIVPTAAIWIIALVGIGAFMWDSTAQQSRRFCYLFLFFSFLAVSPGLYFRPHYFILMLPAVSLLVAAAVNSATRSLEKLSSGKLFAVLPAALFVVGFAASLLTQKEFLFVMDPISVCRSIYPRDPFVELVRVAEYIRSHTAKTERFAVLGSDPQTYFYARRRSVTGYMYTYPLTEDQPYAALMQKELIADVESGRPKFIVWVDDWKVAPGPRPFVLSWMGQYLATNYDVVSIIALPGSGGANPTQPNARTPIVEVFRLRA
jgi:Dolichyl-phosphate-mannose-protein mannosyltransferase